MREVAALLDRRVPTEHAAGHALEDDDLLVVVADVVRAAVRTNRRRRREPDDDEQRDQDEQRRRARAGRRGAARLAAGRLRARRARATGTGVGRRLVDEQRFGIERDVVVDLVDVDHDDRDVVVAAGGVGGVDEELGARAADPARRAGCVRCRARAPCREPVGAEHDAVAGRRPRRCRRRRRPRRRRRARG